MPKFEANDLHVQIVERIFILLTLNEEGAEKSCDNVLSELPLTKDTFLLLLGLTTNFIEECADSEGLTELGKTVFDFAGVSMPANQPWIGPNAFSHESGIHVAAVLNCPLTYECVPPEAVGNRRRLVLGKHSGTAIVKSRLAERGVSPSQERICDIVREIKKLGEMQGRVSDDQFWSIVEQVMSRPDDEGPCA